MNLAIAATGSVVLAVAALSWGAGTAPSLLLGAAAFALFAGVIYLRGYLVPYTPTLTKTYLPDRVLRRFEKTPRGQPGGDGGGTLDVERLLVENGLLAACEKRDDWCLPASVQRQWRGAMQGFDGAQARQDAAADLLGVDADRLAIERYGDAAVVSVGDDRVGQWESPAAFVADLAANEVLGEELPGWAGLGLEDRGRVLHSLRMFLERCPSCESTLSFGQQTVESCCRSVDVVSLSCDSCGVRLFEIEAPDGVSGS